MALRTIRIDGDDVLRKKSREVEEFNDKLTVLVNDMAETMYEASGIGLAAPQVGILKRVIILDIGDGLMEFINPVISECSGEQIEAEGCLSIPDIFGEVKRPLSLKLDALRLSGEKVSMYCEGDMARVISHETDHLDGILFKDKVVRYLDSAEMDRIARKKRKNKRKQV